MMTLQNSIITEKHPDPGPQLWSQTAVSGSSVITVASVLPADMRGLFIVAEKEKICHLKSLKKIAETFLVFKCNSANKTL